ncbi:MAG TPA: ELM1/GtrOC1 family putative glycosyltransferase [Sphingomicrobium sp.]
MSPLIWALISDHPGDNAQVLALAEEIGLEFKTKAIRYTVRKRLPGNNRRVSLLSLDQESRKKIEPPWPDLLIMVGPRSQPIGRYVKKESGGRTRLVLIGRPRAPASAFDLIFDTRQYRLPDAPNLQLLPVVMSRYRKPLSPTKEEIGWLDSLPRPHLLLMIGGPIRYWNISQRRVAEVVRRLLARATKLGGSLIVTASPRTPGPLIRRARHELAAAANGRLAEGMPRFQILIDDADELFPTGDSVSMISESVITGKPVGIVSPEQTYWGRIMLGPERSIGRTRFRDLRRFWSYLRDQRLAGTIDQPVGGRIDNPVVTAAELVRELLDFRDRLNASSLLERRTHH